MNKVKVNAGLACVLLIGGLIAGWQALLLISILMLIFCEVDDKIKGVMTSVVTFAIGIALVRIGWDLLYDVANIATTALTNLFTTLNDWMPLSGIYKVNTIFFIPLSKLLSTIDSVFVLLVRAVELYFILGILKNQPAKSNPLTNVVNKMVTNVINYVNGMDFGFPAQPVVPAAPMATMQPMQTVQPMQPMAPAAPMTTAPVQPVAPVDPTQPQPPVGQ